MSCGNPHDVPCTEVLDRVYAYLDRELGEGDCAKIRQHLDECGPCLREYGLEEVVKQLVHKHCGHDAVPGELRVKVMVRIQQVQAELRVSQAPAE
ncbi:MAG TPA: mycothiol system anti-sigma-R factor [Streptosporangiaceae bacterium]|nr:mycothiol system anti-sigma-R factor [Streptosporangiaceae bacterium]